MRRLTLTVLAALFALTGVTGPHGCVNPAGHVRGSCKHKANHTAISGTVLAINGDIAQFRQDNGATISIDQSNLLENGQGLRPGGHYALRGHFSNNMFVVQTGANYYAGNYPNNGYPYPGSNATVQGIVTSISGSRVTIMQGLFNTVTINDQQAVNNGTAQNLYVGRSITAYGYWSNDVFFATSIG
jgi:hypothetical protein